MSNALGLTLIFLGIGLLVGLVILVEYLKEHYPDTWLGRLSKKISKVIDDIPFD